MGSNASFGRFPKEGPCLTKNGNTHKCVRKRYLVANSQKDLVYVVKTVGDTGNSKWFNHDGHKRERHTDDTIGEFRATDGIWYTVYWRCQESDHDSCSHDAPEDEIKKQTVQMAPTPIAGSE